jgi:lysophospholipase L1-like esterase
VRQYASANGHVYLDYWAALADKNGMLRAELSEDGLHPNAKGYGLMAPLAEKATAAAGKGSR